MTIICKSIGGIGNRINTLVSAMAMQPQEPIVFKWLVNKHIPAPADAFFGPMEGVRFINQKSYTNRSQLNLCGVPCVHSWYPCNPSSILSFAKYVNRITEAYARVRAGLLRFEETPEQPNTLAIGHRHFVLWFDKAGDTETVGFKELCAAMRKVVKAQGITKVFATSDSAKHRKRLLYLADKAGLETQFVPYVGASGDMDRSIESINALIDCWSIMARCKAVLVNTNRVTSYDILTGAVPMYYSTRQERPYCCYSAMRDARDLLP